MANAIELSNNGKVYAYVCGICHKIPNIGWYKIKDGPDPQFVERIKEYAENCCRCRGCGEVLPFDVPEYAKYNYLSGYYCQNCWPNIKEDMDKSTEEYEIKLAKYHELLNKSLEGAKDIIKAKLLRDYMSEISERYYCAGWLINLEYSLWDMVINDGREFGMGEVAEYEIDVLKKLSEECGGWWYFSDDNIGELFIDIDGWNGKFEESLKNGSGNNS